MTLAEKPREMISSANDTILSWLMSLLNLTKVLQIGDFIILIFAGVQLAGPYAARVFFNDRSKAVLMLAAVEMVKDKLGVDFLYT